MVKVGNPREPNTTRGQCKTGNEKQKAKCSNTETHKKRMESEALGEQRRAKSPGSTRSHPCSSEAKAREDINTERRLVNRDQLGEVTHCST